MKKIKSILIGFIFIFVSGCGYTPLFKKSEIGFEIDELIFDGDRQINMVLSEQLKKYKNLSDQNSYDLKVNSQYEKSIINKDRSGNPKNFKIKVITNVKFTLNESVETIRNFNQESIFSAQIKKITEREIEKKYKKNIAKLIAEDIIFFLKNK